MRLVLRRFPLRYLVLLLALLGRTPLDGERLFSGTAELEQALRRLEVLGSVLMIAAHPDDENTALLAYFARGRHVRTAYLSLTRGEGGQNLIGAEQGDLLGVIRTQELLAARSIDGAQQFFSRAIDFGFSKSAAEAIDKWGHDATLSDIVWVIRRFRPDVIILRFSGTPQDGHGQHQASAILGKEAYFAAGDPERFAEQLRWVKPWKAKRLLFNTFSFTAEQQRASAALPNRLEIDTGQYNPVLGKSYGEIAGISRSMHRSQGMGAPERRGPSRNYLVPVAGEMARQDPFDGIDTSWKRVPGGEQLGQVLAEAVRSFEPAHPEKLIPRLLEARSSMMRLQDPWARRKLQELDEAIALCSGLWLDATTDRYAAAPGSTVRVQTTAINRSSFPLRLESVKLSGLGQETTVDIRDAALPEGQLVTASAERRIPEDQPPSQPFWLARARVGNIYTVDHQKWIGEPDSPPVMTAVFEVLAGSAVLELRKPVLFRYVDPERGELTRPFLIEPAVAVNPLEPVVMFPSHTPRRIQIAVQANVAEASGDLRLAIGPGWKCEPNRQPFRLSEAGEQREFTFTITPPAENTRALLTAAAETFGRSFSWGMRTLSYPHIPVQVVFPPAESTLVRADIRNSARRVGYIVGAGDHMPEALRQMGCDVTFLGPQDLEQRNLADFDAIVTGVRAYNVRPDLRANQPRLLDYVRNGGRLIVQYNVASPALPNLGPYPFVVGRLRVAVETAPVTLLRPGHPLVTAPNAISTGDFADWVQERGLYFASSWDSHYETVFECHDPGEPPQQGGMLYARYGKGVYIFTAYSWFRQLPAGVSGAYRLFANLLSAP